MEEDDGGCRVRDSEEAPYTHPHAARNGPAMSPTSASLVAHPAGKVERRGAPFGARPVPRMASEDCRKITNPGTDSQPREQARDRREPDGSADTEEGQEQGLPFRE